MAWKDWSYWLRGGIILSLAYLVIGFIVVNYLTEYFLGPAPYGVDVIFSFFNIVGFPGFPLIGNSIKSGEWLTFLVIVIDVIFYFLIGALIGWIYGKIKGKKEGRI